ncbi:hypothetical protein ACJD0Z_00155 [Flavobacteriaceae bacterium M23B6Z8]
MNKIVFRERLPGKARILGVFFIVFGIISWTQPDAFIVLTLVGIVLLIFRIEKEIHSDFKNKIRYKLGFITVFKKNWRIKFPDYISMFKTHSSTKHEWGPVAALGKESKDLKYHIRFFTENEWTNIVTTNRRNEVEEAGVKLKKLLQVEVLNKL